MEIELKTLPDGKLVAEFPVAKLAEELKTQLGESLPAGQTEDTAKLQEDYAKLEEEVAGLKEEVARLESEEHAQEVITHWLNNLDAADPEHKVALGVKLGLDKMFKEAEVAEETELVQVGVVKEPAVVAETKPKTKIVFSDPHDPSYKHFERLGCWRLNESGRQ